MHKPSAGILVALASVTLMSCAADPVAAPTGGVTSGNATPHASEPVGGTPSPAVPEPGPVDSGPTTSAPTLQPTTPTPSVMPEEAPPETTPPLETTPPPSGGWEQMEVEVTDESMTARLDGTSREFQDFIGQLVATEDSSGCRSQITVKAYHQDGFASGLDFAPGCGGLSAIWGMVDGQWATLVQMQAVIPCEEIESHRVPREHPQLECLGPEGSLVSY